MDKKISFWLFQTSFWILYLFFKSEFIYGNFPMNHWVVTGYFFLHSGFGVLLSLVIRKQLTSKPIKNLSKYYLLPSVIVIAFALSHLWLVEVKVLDYFITNIFNVPTEIRYTRDIISATIVLSIWSFLFLLFNSWYEISVQQENLEKAHLLARNAQLNALRYQINPHFLFNALNSVRALIYKSPSDADEMISKLSDFMRYTLSKKSEKEIPLEEEIEAIKSYLNIEKVRFRDKLKLEIKVDPIANEYPIPSFLVIPLIENAVKYGMKTSRMPLEIFVSAEVVGNDLAIVVRNTGSWYIAKENQENELISTGSGLKIIKDRLENIYPDQHKFNIKKTNGFVSIHITISKIFEDGEDK